MPQPQIKTPEQFQADIQNGIIAKTDQITDFSDNTPEAALTYSLATQFDFVQQQNTDTAALMRGKTSFGADLDSFVGDYVDAGFTPRLEALAAMTTLHFQNAQPNPNQEVIPFGTIVQNRVQPPALPVQFQLIEDDTNPASSTELGGYVFPSNALDMYATAQCLTAGRVGNLDAGSLTIIATPNIPADSVTNDTDIVTGQDQEEDGPLFQRFSDWMAGLALGVERAICAAVSSTQVGIAFTYNDLVDGTNTAKDAYFAICADDGSGAISANTINAIKANVDAVRAGGIGFDVVAPTNQTVTIAVTGTKAQPGFQLTDVQAAIQNAIIAYVNANGPGGSPYGTGGLNPSGKLSYVGVVLIVVGFIGGNAGQGLLEYASVTINGAYQDIPLTNFQLARTDTAHVTIS